MRRARRALLLISFAAALPSAAGEETLQGFTPDASATQRQWEQKLAAVPSPANMRAYMERLAARPHHVGSPYGKDNAEWILARFKEWGWDAKIESFDVLFPTPRERVLEMVAPTRFAAKLREPSLAVDPTSNQAAEQLPTYNAYSVDGDVTGPLVYVNYGLPKDYEELERLGVSVKGAIVIARYGNSWRGIKPKVAAEHGAVGCLIYSDPRDDGYFEDETFPEGPMRPRDGVQRGSAMDFPSASPGDPLTPGVGATPEAKRLEVKDAPSLTKIPVLPISWGDAQPLLAAVKGPMAPAAWRGALPIPYHVGPGPARVHLRLKFDWDRKPVRDVIATLPGAEQPDQWVIRGNHHDAWVNGADDPVSALVAMLEEARALGELAKGGWRPRRTIVYCAWDGEEPMLLGSTEWVETHAAELRERAVAYLNSDVNRRGYLSFGGSHTLERFLNGVARAVSDPESQVSVFDRERFRRIAEGSSADREEIYKRHDLRLEALGSGTDFTGFLDHIGVASLNLGFQGEDLDGIYHSIYDDFYWYTHFSDGDLVYGRALAQTAGIAVLRLANAELLPFDFDGLADAARGYLDELKKLASAARADAIERNRQLDDGLFRALLDPRHPTVAPARADVPPFLGFAPLENAVDRLERSAHRYRAAIDKAGAAGVTAPALAELNRKLIESERRLTNAQGLPRRPWYKHVLYAPGVYTGYGVKTMPGVREAIEQKRWDEANAEIVRVAEALAAEGALVDELAGLLTSGGEGR
jgi:N-acetylated-alpha-linked acidic dipeptidase